MRAFTKSAVVAIAATAVCTLPLGVATAQAIPFGSLGSLGSSDPEPENPGPEAPAPKVTVSKTTGVADGETLTVTGTNFGRDGQGVYVGLAQHDKYSTTSMAAYNAAAWIKAADIVDGGFTTTLPSTAIKGDANCFENPCAIFTFADRYTPTDRSQDTTTAVTFAPQ